MENPAGQKTVDSLRRVARSPLGGDATGGSMMLASLLGGHRERFDYQRSGSVHDRGPPPAILSRPEGYRAQVKSAGGWRATVSGHDAGRGCRGGRVARSPARGGAAGAINVAIPCEEGMPR